jgi:hypothetical protein
MSKKLIVEADLSEPGEAAEKRVLKVPPVIGWREWVQLPGLGIERVKAKVDTGARTSCLHAINIHYISKHGKVLVRFDVHPQQRTTREVVRCEAPLIEERPVTDSGGKRTVRPVVEAQIELHGERFPVELTLISRDEMGFRMLLGRQALKGRYLVNPGRSYLAGRPKRRKKKKKKIPMAKARS